MTDTATVSEEYPVWSSDATSLATVENHFDGSEDIVLFDVVVGTTGALELRRTANVTALAAGTLGSVDSFSHLDWAKDGDAIAFAASAPGSLRDIWVLDVTTPTSPTATKLTNTARNSEFAPTWSEDDTSIAYRKNGKGKDQGIFIVSATGGTATALLAGGDNTQPSWRR